MTAVPAAAGRRRVAARSRADGGHCAHIRAAARGAPRSRAAHSQVAGHDNRAAEVRCVRPDAAVDRDHSGDRRGGRRDDRVAAGHDKRRVAVALGRDNPAAVDGVTPHAAVARGHNADRRAAHHADHAAAGRDRSHAAEAAFVLLQAAADGVTPPLAVGRGHSADRRVAHRAGHAAAADGVRPRAVAEAAAMHREAEVAGHDGRRSVPGAYRAGPALRHAADHNAGRNADPASNPAADRNGDRIAGRTAIAVRSPGVD
jgi:hypothetical protein